MENEIKILVAYSGGKDSHASLIWAVLTYGAKRIKAVFCDTGWEHDFTYKHIKETCEVLGVELVILKSKKYEGLVDMAIKKKRFPSTKARFCTEELKSIPMIDYILDEVKSSFIVIQGIRKDESASRSKMLKKCTFFKHYFEPYGFDKKGKPKYHSYRKDEIKEFCMGNQHIVFRPCFDWTGVATMQYIIDNGHRPNQLYFQSSKRVGCFPCVMCTLGEIKAIADNSPDYKDRLINAESDINALGQRSNFFGPGYIPARFCKNTYIKDKKSKNKKTGIINTRKVLVGIPTAEEVFNYVQRHASVTELEFEPKHNRSCMSHYGICE
jgi:3'-phosphoadenosine 5'-phosphosulfate sulfotransferase (PAPS reductase)/FAD synthetase